MTAAVPDPVAVGTDEPGRRHTIGGVDPAPAHSTRRGMCQPVRGEAAFDIIISGGHRERGGVSLGPSQWRQPFERVPITVVQRGERHVVGEGLPLVDRKGNLRIRGMYASTPLGEYVRTLVSQGILVSAALDYTDTIDDAGQLVRQVLGGVFTLPIDPPPALDVAGPSEPAAELIGLAARVYVAAPAERAALAGQVITCAESLLDEGAETRPRGVRPSCGSSVATVDRRRLAT